MQEKINKIRQYCIEANSSIKDLVFGCIIRDMETDRELIFLGLDDDQRIRACCPVDQYSTTWIGDECCAIIGRSIRLTDVLMVIRQKEENIFITSNGEFGELHMESEEFTMKPIPSWNLLKDDLTLQSEKTLDFIITLIEEK